MKKLFLPVLLFIGINLFAQNKKPLDHSVYDGWKSIGERMISNDGKYIVYAVNPQEGDGELVIQNPETRYKKVIPRAYGAVITQDSRYLVFKIRPFFQDTRQAKIKKKKADDMPKDSIGILELGKEDVVKIARVKGFKTAEKGSGWVAYQMEKPLPDTTKKTKPPVVVDSAKMNMDKLVKLADSVIRKSIDSVRGNVTREEVISAAQKAAREILRKGKDELLFDEYGLTDAEGDDAPGGAASEGTDLVVRRMGDNKEKTFKLVSEYYFDKKGTRILIETTKNSKDSNSRALVLLYDLGSERTDTVMKAFNDAKNFSFDEEGTQLAFVAERDSSAKSLQKFYKLWYHTTGQDSARLLAEKNTVGMQIGFTISENAAPRFSKDGKKLFFGTAPIKAPKDTTLVDFELARLDVWHYNDDYLQPQQVKQLDQELRRSYMAVMRPGDDRIVQLGADDAENITLVDEGNAGWVLGESTKGNRVEAQWTGRVKTTAYAISTADGKRRMIKANSIVNFEPSPAGKFVYWYDPAQKNYFAWDAATGNTKNITDKIKEPIYDVENDVPDHPRQQGITGWTENDRYFLINDVYDIWQVDPVAAELPRNISNGWGKKHKTDLNYVRLDPEKRFFKAGETILLRSQNKSNKYGGFYTKKLDEVSDPALLTEGPYLFANPVKAKDAEQYIVQRSNISQSELFATADLKMLAQLSDVASQQKEYNWLGVELVKWKMFDGKMSEGLLFKPENFDPKKKYPVIFYFYERNADGLYAYRAPAPSASTVNIAYFVSNGYLVFDPNIYYKDGEPGPSAYNSVVSAAKYLSKMPWVDSARMAIQGQSWGGYQVAYLITKTNMFRAAWAGAPVANMTSAYGGIRWGSGLNRQFQYEHTQSRIGANLWQRQDLYLKNSPLFSADKVNTPLVIMHNDADGAVPWYQGIEYFTALRRLGKKVWMLQYNGEDHNLVERKNRKDLSIRLSQFFDYYLKDAKPAKWIRAGLPATEKGKDWGLD
ncbi:MAG: prolyl oligopeptidase family serine peptidase [Ferruginibacter sp.]|nr:prolyl oligopeptidase family serine peptidase [Ferruginibacter sp.]MBU9935433.1 prolyl oligopeptidase family serine peptidase [Ferruginibacter sp.]